VPRIIVGAADAEQGREAAPGRSQTRPVGGGEWGLLAVLGSVFGLVALSDLVLTIVPWKFGSAEWEFGTVTQILNNFPLFAVGLTFIALTGFAKRSSALLRLSGTVFALVWLALVGMAVLWGRNLEVAEASVTDPVLKLGLSRAITRTTVQFVAYGVGFGLLGWKALAGARSLRTHQR